MPQSISSRASSSGLAAGLRFIRPRELRVPKGLRIAIGAAFVLGLIIWLVPTQMDNELDGRRDVVTLIAGLFALGLAIVVVVRLGLETARQREGEASAMPGSHRDPDPGVLQLVGVDLREAFLPKAQLEQVELSEALLDDADLSSARLSRSRLGGAKLRRADLRRAHLAEADLRDADLHRADLRGANLWHADLRGASLRDASLDGARLRGARYDDETSWPPGVSPSARGAVNVDGEPAPST